MGALRVDVNYRARHIYELADILIRAKWASNGVVDVTLELLSLYELVPEFKCRRCTSGNGNARRAWGMV